MKITPFHILAAMLFCSLFFVSLPDSLANKTPTYHEHIRFSEFLTEGEKGYCNTLTYTGGHLFVTYRFSSRDCQLAYAEYKIARQLSNHDVNEALRKLYESSDNADIVRKRDKLLSNDPVVGVTRPGHSYFIYWFDLIDKKSVPDYDNLLNQFKAMYESVK